MLMFLTPYGGHCSINCLCFANLFINSMLNITISFLDCTCSKIIYGVFRKLTAYFRGRIFFVVCHTKLNGVIAAMW